MKTTMQKLIDELENKIKPIENNDDVYFNYGIRKSIQIALELLEIEKEQIINACNSAFEDKTTWGERYYNQTYNNGI
jgi:hypothetical protein|tara:strand:- start:939 stop:1169 length:231 start_codon:yes stop_codon:yes gene_type:complete